MSRQYKKPPITEALCEFQFGQDSTWDFTVPGLVYEKVRAMFPKRSQFARVTMGLAPGVDEITPQVGATPIMRFSTEDERMLIQVGTHLLTINHLQPYSSWENFFSVIQNTYASYREVASPRSIHRIGLRYINTIQIENSGINLDDYFEFRPYIGPNLPQIIGPFMLSVQLPFEEPQDILNLRLASIIGSSSEKTDLILDLDYSLAQPEKIELDDAFNWIKTAHRNVEKIFEACLTEKLRHLFEE